MTALEVIHMAAGAVVLAEALNKLERTNLSERGLSWRNRFVALLKLAAWALLAVGAAGALATPALHLGAPSLQDVCVLGGFALHVIRSRLKETRSDSDDFTQTRVFKGLP